MLCADLYTFATWFLNTVGREFFGKYYTRNQNDELIITYVHIDTSTVWV